MRVPCVIVLAGLLLAVTSAFPAPDGSTNADNWLTNTPPTPQRLKHAIRTTNEFARLHAEVIAGRFQIVCPATNVTDVRLVASIEAPGHWPARDWRSLPMHRNRASWFRELSIAELHIPVVYFLTGTLGTNLVTSPMRIAIPGALGLETPTRFFWPFVEGFEEGMEGGEASNAELRTAEAAKTGHAALRVEIPPTRRSVTVTTTRLRGWFFEEHDARGLGVWMRTTTRPGSAVFSLVANAFTSEQVVARCSQVITVSQQWTRVRLPFDRFPKWPLGETDLLTIELTGERGTQFLIDDLHLLGRWSNEF